MDGNGPGTGETLEKLLAAYRGYYNVWHDSEVEGFAAEAEFRLHDEQYFLVRRAKISEADSREIIFFAETEALDEEQALALCGRAWEEGVRRTNPGSDHMGTDISLVILAESVSPEAARTVRSFNRTKSYRFGFWGYNRFRVVAYDLGRHAAVRNRLGDTLEKVICDIDQKS